MTARKRQKYLVTSDLSVLVRRWAESSGFHVPGREFFREIHSALEDELRRIFDPQGIEVEFLSWGTMKGRMLDLIEDKSEGLPIISLDPVYVENPDMRFHTNRLQGWSKRGRTWTDLGNGPRPNAGMIATQITRISQHSALFERDQKRVVVVDDGVWTGRTFFALQELLKEHEIEVAKFLVGLHIQQANSAITLDSPIIPAEKGLFKVGEIVEWVCERDFFLGVDYSGRTIGRNSEGGGFNGSSSGAEKNYYPNQPMAGNYGAPYVLPLGAPQLWASIPRSEVKQFSRVCLELARQLYNAIETETARVLGYGRPVLVRDLARPPFFYRHPDYSVLREIETSMKILGTMRV